MNLVATHTQSTNAVPISRGSPQKHGREIQHPDRLPVRSITSVVIAGKPQRSRDGHHVRYNASVTLASPWTMLPSLPPYVLASDAAAIEQFNANASPTHRLHTELLPEPYFGSRDAPVVLLGLNPGFSDDDAETHLRPDFLAASRRNLVHAPGAYPFQYLDPRFESTPGGGWWRSKLRPVLDAGVDREVLAENLLCVEWFPYHSKTFRQLRTPLVSQQYGFTLVDEAVRRDALIIDMRSSALWSASVPALVSHRRRHALRNPRNVTVSRGNYPGDFAALVALLGTRRHRTA